jgi:hypothetical protein
MVMVLTALLGFWGSDSSGVGVVDVVLVLVTVLVPLGVLVALMVLADEVEVVLVA